METGLGSFQKPFAVLCILELRLESNSADFGEPFRGLRSFEPLVVDIEAHIRHTTTCTLCQLLAEEVEV